MREPWLYLVTHLAFRQEPIHQQWWRDYLNHVSLDDAGKLGTATGERKGEVFALFNAVFPDSMVTSHVQPTFFGKELRELDARLCQEVLWEVYEMGFRMELLTMDRKLCPSAPGSQLSADSLYSEQRRIERVAEVFSQKTHIRISALPTSHSGLAAVDIKDRVPVFSNNTGADRVDLLNEYCQSHCPSANSRVVSFS